MTRSTWAKTARPTNRSSNPKRCAIIPNLEVFRPADAVEAGLAWVEALKRTDGPTALLLTRQNVPVVADEESVAVDRGGYVIKKEGGASIDAVIVAAGSEVALAIDAARARSKVRASRCG